MGSTLKITQPFSNDAFKTPLSIFLPVHLIDCATNCKGWAQLLPNSFQQGIPVKWCVFYGGKVHVSHNNTKICTVPCILFFFFQLPQLLRTANKASPEDSALTCRLISFLFASNKVQENESIRLQLDSHMEKCKQQNDVAFSFSYLHPEAHAKYTQSSFVLQRRGRTVPCRNSQSRICSFKLVYVLNAYSIQN